MPPPLETRVLFDHEREIAPLAVTVRTRALARARVAVTAGIAAWPFPTTATPQTRWAAIATALLWLAGAAAGAGVYEFRARRAPLPLDHPVAATVDPPAQPGPSAKPPDAPVSSPAHGVPTSIRPPTETGLSKAAAGKELRLLRLARAAVAREDFAAALPPLAEDTRLFKDGGLVEEREALWVKALAGLGRMDEARSAAATFKARFPRSVLLPAVSQMPASAP